MADDQYIWGPQKIGDLVAMASYKNGRYTVIVRDEKSGRVAASHFLANFEPRWGIDVADVDEIMTRAEELAQQLEAQNDRGTKQE
jgi:hypothetical protein